MGTLLSSTSPDDPGFKVQLGFWTNWSRGPIWGATLTLNRQQGSLLVAFTAFFITVVATRFWRLACSILHRKLSTERSRDALHCQRQAVFRNSTSSQSALWSLTQIAWAWRHLDQKNLSRTLPSMLFALIILLAFSLASGFSSSISTAVGDEVLIDGSNCGYFDSSTLNLQAAMQVNGPVISSIANNAANYAQQVYSLNDTRTFTNTVFVKRILETKSNLEAPCPFIGGLCRSNTSNLLLDSGYIDTSQGLGVNLPPDQRILFRKVTQCAPLTTAGRTEQMQNWTDDSSGVANYTSYNYGPFRDWETRGFPNVTFLVKDVASQYALFGNRVSECGNSLTPQGDFLPEPGLRMSDADVSLIFLTGSGMVSSAPLNDPWYRFDTISSYNLSINMSNVSLPAYQPSEAASPLGCTSQVQICKGASPRNETCGRLSSSNDAWIDAVRLFGIDPEDPDKYDYWYQLMAAYEDNEEASRFLWVLKMIASQPTDIPSVVHTLGSQSLASRSNAMGNIQGPLPDDQWKIDVTYWWNVSLAVLQSVFVSTAHGSNDLSVTRYQTRATNPGQRSICENQKILSAQHTSVSVFGLYFTYITGTLIIVLSFVIDSVFTCAQKRWRYKEYENLEWISNETLQLQRLAYNESGQGEWSNCTEPIPVTTSGQLLGPLNLNNLEHPRIGHPRSPRSSKEMHRLGVVAHAPHTDSEGSEEHSSGEEIEENPLTTGLTTPTHHNRRLTV
ncbi:hypothetical protein F4808DRAFT_450298 [Astrocystis sublimbata]|nr:hypothetical protein F4808DRAFT_450298 [Astrocystis sublimbata]